MTIPFAHDIVVRCLLGGELPMSDYPRLIHLVNAAYHPRAREQPG